VRSAAVGGRELLVVVQIVFLLLPSHQLLLVQLLLMQLLLVLLVMISLMVMMNLMRWL
jgi:hypothetical protein